MQLTRNEGLLHVLDESAFYISLQYILSYKRKNYSCGRKILFSVHFLYESFYNHQSDDSAYKLVFESLSLHIMT